MRKGQFYLLSSLLIIVSSLFTFKIATLGDGNIIGGLFIGILSFLVIFTVYRGFTPVKWIGLIGFSLLAFGTFMAGLEHEDFVFYLMALGYAFIAWQLVGSRSIVQVESINEEAVPKIHTPPVTLPPNTFATENKVYTYPTLVKRIQALFVDSSIILAILIVVMLITDGSANATTIRITALLVAICLYEPLLTMSSGTLGQRAIGIRVRNINDPSKNITLLQSYARTFAKTLLGWLSFLTIHFNEQHRAIHDFVGSSVVIKISKQSF